MGFNLDTQATRSDLMSVDTTLAASIDATQDYIPVASITNFSTSVVAEIETTNEVVSFTDINENLLARSEEFSYWTWAKFTVTITADAGTAPDGTTTADKLIPNVGVNRGIVYTTQPIPLASARNTFSVFAKSDGYDYINVISQTSGAYSPGVQFNLSTGSVVTSDNATGTITDEGDGWYRCSILPDAGAPAYASLVFQANDGTAPNTGDYYRSTFTADGSSGVLIWGTQLEGGITLSPYIPTTTTALFRLTNVTRGVNGTTAATASSGDAIQQLPYALLNVDMPIRLTGLSVSSDGTGAGRLTLCDKVGTHLCDVDIPDTKIFDLTFDGGILFPNGIYVANSDNITAYTLYTDKYSGDSL
jgi:hypothetical protein